MIQHAGSRKRHRKNDRSGRVACPRLFFNLVGPGSGGKPPFLTYQSLGEILIKESHTSRISHGINTIFPNAPGCRTIS